ncbi:hypothetical protein [Streptantibioticus ferralitis]|uniref:Uncharacterized protein n=1 Tax=Streptantibioticus ferralitis TaxID=236510 RepID=A0ABT5ZAR3_9ACTN|nr:hypothetical protein [Streptantibioticus ferralitis]MDF2260931.1 hypothetical protein [Streptantibioticus ferralitis]
MEELPDLEIEGGEWYRAVPPPAVPVPARHMPPELHGKPALAVIDGLGALHDLRILGDAHQDQTGRWVNVVPELDYWRTHITPGTSAPARRVPLDQVWVEHRLPYEASAERPFTAAVPASDPNALLRRLAPGPGTPGGRTPLPARTVPHLHGRRIIQVNPLGFAWNLRAVSEPYDLDGEITVNVVSAHDYYRWVITGKAPDPTPIALYLLWTE